MDIFDDIKIISNLLSIDIKKVIEYPDKTRDLLIEKILNNPDETESIDKIKSLLDNYTIENKKELIEITRLNYIVNMNSQAIT
jgi:patatin-like phospholipase/acyl hydrolase